MHWGGGGARLANHVIHSHDDVPYMYTGLERRISHVFDVRSIMLNVIPSALYKASINPNSYQIKCKKE